jgi:hypothetical protein
MKRTWFLVASLLALPCMAEEAVDVDGTTIIGNNEQPKALFIMPWHTPEHTAGLDQPVSSLVDQPLAPLDREEFQRRLRFYDDINRHSTHRSAQSVE